MNLKKGLVLIFEIYILYFHCSIVSLLRSVFDEKLRVRRGLRFALDEGITEYQNFEFYNAKLDICSVHHFIIYHETEVLHERHQ